VRRSLAHTALQTVDGDHDGGAFEHLHQPIEQAFVVVMSGFEIFFQDALGITDGLNSQFLIAHSFKPHATTRELNLNVPQLVPEAQAQF
jgi:hypothetical protein